VEGDITMTLTEAEVIDLIRAINEASAELFPKAGAQWERWQKLSERLRAEGGVTTRLSRGSFAGV
jgi:hypothetical protein